MITTIYVERINGIMGGVWQEKTIHADHGVDLAYIAGRKQPQYPLPVPVGALPLYTFYWKDQDYINAIYYCEKVDENYWTAF